LTRIEGYFSLISAKGNIMNFELKPTAANVLPAISKSVRKALSMAAVGLTLAGAAVTQTTAAPTEATRGGATSVRLSADFVNALGSLKVTPAPIAPGRLKATQSGVVASFPITAGAVDLGTIKAEIDHAGGLSLTAGSMSVELSAFVIDLAGNRPVLTGLVTVNDSLLGRVPLFDLALTSRSVSANDDFLRVGDVAVTLSQEAAAALNGVFKVTAFVFGFPIGTGFVRAILEDGRH
jgi:hypothetical protein